jgi:hypothetical protein
VVGEEKKKFIQNFDNKCHWQRTTWDTYTCDYIEMVLREIVHEDFRFLILAFLVHLLILCRILMECYFRHLLSWSPGHFQTSNFRGW